MRGFHAMNRNTMVRTLYGSMDHALFHDVWSNTSHDDRDFSIGHMLAWHKESQGEKPFKDDQLYALLFMGKNAPYLRSHPHDDTPDFLETYSPDVSDDPDSQQIANNWLWMQELADEIVMGFGPTERERYLAFWEKARQYWVEQVQVRAKYNLTG